MKHLTRSLPIWFILIVSLFSILILSLSTGGSAAAVNKIVSAPAALQANNPLVAGKWTNIIPMTDVSVHISLLPNGKVLYWGRDKQTPTPTPTPVSNPTPTPDPYNNQDVEGHCNTYLFDSLYADDAGSVTETIANDTTNLFCSGHSFLPDGRLLVAGGHIRAAGNPVAEGLGDNAINIFDPKLKTWTKHSVSMPKGRWYPYNLTLANGETIVMSGSFFQSVGGVQKNTIPDIFDLNGGLRQTAADTIGGLDKRENYPNIFLAPDGRVFYAVAPNNDVKSRFLNVATNTWTQIDNAERHDYGTSVMYAPGKILLVGGAALFFNGQRFENLPQTLAETIDLNAAAPTWTTVSPMNNARIYPTATLLPDGKVFVAGGTRCMGSNNVKYTDPTDPSRNCENGQVLKPEIWDPVSGVWTEMAPQQETRVYHSSVILLPDGRLLVSGSGLPLAVGEMHNSNGLPCTATDILNDLNCRNSGHKNAEIFSPPYLFEMNGSGAVVNALRPAITSAPETISYNQQFTVGVGNLPRSDIKEVVLVRLPSVTHGFNQDQRRVVLLKQDDPLIADALKVTAPVDGKACPPGPYMMFLIRNGSNTPSMAKIVRVGNLSLDKTSQIFLPEDYAGDSETLNGTINVTASAGVSWTASVEASAASWITLTQSTGTGNGAVTFAVAPNVVAGVPTSRRTPAKIFVKINGEQTTGHEFTVYQAGTFSDIMYPTTQFHADISKIFGLGVTVGCGGPNYCPADSVTRLQMALFLSRALGGNDLPDAPQRFEDVPMPADPNARAGYRAVEFLYRKGITNGCQLSPAKYCPNDVVNREQMAVFIIRALGLSPAPPAEDPFADVPKTHWAAPFIAEMKRLGITSGCGGNNYCPTSPVTRQQMARFLSVAFKL